MEGSTQDFHRVVFRIGADLDYGDDGPNPGIDFPAAQLSSYQDVDNNLHGKRTVCPFEQLPEKPATLVSLITLKVRSPLLAADPPDSDRKCSDNSGSMWV